MRDEFEMPGYTAIGLQKVETHGIECAVEIEPDESVGLSNWYIARVYIEGTVPGQKRRWHAITERHPLHSEIVNYAMTYRSEELAELWAEWCADRPKGHRSGRHLEGVL